MPQEPNLHTATPVFVAQSNKKYYYPPLDGMLLLAPNILWTGYKSQDYNYSIQLVPESVSVSTT